MIAVGTICILVGAQIKRVGCFCTVIGPPTITNIYQTLDGEIRNGVLAYPLELASGDRAPYGGWSAPEHQLIPIAPPGLTERDDKHEPVAA